MLQVAAFPVRVIKYFFVLEFYVGGIMHAELSSLIAVVLFNDLRIPGDGSTDVGSIPRFRRSVLLPC
jgi:hypothetical protein